MAEQDHDYIFKILLIGDSGVGKSPATFHSGQLRAGFEIHYRGRLWDPCDGYTGKSEMGKKLKAQIWDTAGQERYQAITAFQYRGAVGALIVYDITKRETFVNAREWLRKAQDFGETQIVISLVGNKCDLNHVRAVTTEEAKEFAVDNNLLFMETSALDATNIDAAFEELLGNIYNIVASKNLSPTAEKSNIRPLGRTSLIIPSEPQKKESTGCC